jgi:hypothetical protein
MLLPILVRMGSHMKTTIEIGDALLKDAKRVANRDGVTLRTLVESGLRQELEQRRRPTEFRLRRVSFKGKGLQAAARDLTWDQLRELAYAKRSS